MIDRRRFLQSIAAAATTPSVCAAADSNGGAGGFGRLLPDPNMILDLPAGFSYEVISRYGEEMDDGLLVPARHDGMAAFPGEDGDVVLVCNHENYAAWTSTSAFGLQLERLHLADPGKLYDFGRGNTPGAGGTTTIIYDPAERRRKHIRLSLAGTEVNCAGGATPWGSWLSCEEIFRDKGTSFEAARVVQREQDHGYVFEVPAYGDGLADPVPIRAMGRFEHEACAVNPATGVVYMTEDRIDSLFYRYLPSHAGELARGGSLQALAVHGSSTFDTRNWGRDLLRPGVRLETEWIELEEPDVRRNHLRLLGRKQGAAIFARAEGLCYAAGDMVFTCTIGGPQRLGQVFTYRPSPVEATPAEADKPGTLALLAESNASSLLRHADNLTLSPWGDLIICEDAADHCGLVGIRPDGEQYALADNAYTNAELAGVCFSPDGSVLFVNVQQRGLTLAITGPWEDRLG